MTFTTASGLLPAGIAVYVPRGPNGIGLETRYPIGLEDLTSLWERGRSNSLRPAWENGRSSINKRLTIFSLQQEPRKSAHSLTASNSATLMETRRKPVRVSKASLYKRISGCLICANKPAKTSTPAGGGDSDGQNGSVSEILNGNTAEIERSLTGI